MWSSAVGHGHNVLSMCALALQVRILSEQLDTIRDEVDLPHSDGPEQGQAEQDGGSGGRGSANSASRKQA